MQVFSCEICKTSKNTFFIEQLKSLFLKFNSCFQRSLGQRAMPLSPIRSSHRRCSVKKGVLGNFAKFTGKHLCQRLFLNKVVGLRPAALLRRSLWDRCFPVNFAKFLRRSLLQNNSVRLLLPNTYQI